MMRLVLFFTVALLLCYGCDKKIKNPEWENLRTITSADLDTLHFRPFAQGKEIIFEERRWFGHGVTILGDTLGFENLSYYPVLRLINHELMILHHQTEESDKYYIAERSRENNVTTAIAYDITPVSEKNNRRIKYQFQLIPDTETDPPRYHIYIQEEETDENEFSRVHRKYNFSDRGLSESYRNYFVAYSDEKSPYDVHTNIAKNGIPEPLFTTADLSSLDYIDLDSLFKVFPLSLYNNETADVSFYVIPKFYKNHDMVLERTRLSNGEERVLLRKFNYDSYSFRKEFNIDISPESKARYTDNSIKRNFEFLPGNIILVYEEETSPDATVKSLYSYFPGDKTTKAYNRDRRFIYLAGGKDSFFQDREEVQVVRNFLKWYSKNHERIYELPIYVDISEDIETSKYTIDMGACKEAVAILQESGYLSEKHISNWYGYYEKINKKLEEDSETEVGEEVDWYLHDIDIGYYLEHIRNDFMTTFEVRRIAEDKSIVAICLGETGHQVVYMLSEINGKWKIDDSRYFSSGDYYVTGKRGALLVDATDEQTDRMLEHYDLEHEDKYYYEELEDIVWSLNHFGINPQIIGDDYYDICFPDGSHISKDSIYLYDIIFFDYGKKPQISRQANLTYQVPEGF